MVDDGELLSVQLEKLILAFYSPTGCYTAAGAFFCLLTTNSNKFPTTEDTEAKNQYGNHLEAKFCLQWKKEKLWEI
jgi:hypothetical protein